MDREELVGWINSLETKYPVNQWQINKIHIWPIIKVKILALGFKTTTSQNLNSKSVLLKNSLKGSIEFFKFLIRKPEKNSEFYCLAPHFRFYDNGEYINRYYNSLIAASTNKKEFYLFDYGSGAIDYQKNVDYPDKTLFLNNIKYFALALREILWRFYTPKTPWDQFDLFLAEVGDVIGRNSLSINILTRQFAYIDILKNLYKPLLKRKRVDTVYILCYYVSEMYAMNLAASELGITSCDIQHGGQGNAHVAYANYNVVPPTGYKLLPSLFWCWDSASADVINQWVVKQNYHSVITNGNPWVDYCVQKYATKKISDKKIILYTMQPLGDLVLDDYIIEAIRKTPTEYEWWLRLHPRQLDKRNNLITLLKQHNIYDRVEIDKALELPLPNILSQCFIHLSKFSGSILEAYMMRVKTIIISKTGIESFPEVANSSWGICLLSENSDELVEHIISA